MSAVSGRIDTILLGVDGSLESERAAAFTADLARQLDAEVVVVHAVGLLDVWPDSDDVSHPRNSHVHVGELLAGPWTEPLTAAGVRYRTMLRDGPPSMVLLDVADEVNADLLVIGSRGIGQADLYALGSTTARITEVCRRPVIVVPSVRAEP
jgi:nucleotide-binding universal stress UspA family protein